MAEPDGMAEAMATFGEVMTPILEAAVGVRRQAVEGGFDEATASQIGAEYYRIAVGFVAASIGQRKG